jgi:hypothetical protein
MLQNLFLVPVFILLQVVQMAHAAPSTSGASPVRPYDVQCAKPDECPGYVAGLSNNQGVCSSFLVAENIIATNLHCIPEDLRHDDISCKGRIAVFFPKTSQYEKESAECETILHTSPPLVENLLTPDFAFFRLSRSVSRPVLEISQTGMTDMAEMTVFKIDPSEGSPTGTLRKVQCTAVQNSMINPFFSLDKSPVVTLMPCHTIKGNSGSPILGADMKAHGILSAVSVGQVIVADPSVKAGMASGVATLGSNFACLNTFFLGRNQGEPEGCKVKTDAKTRDLMRSKIVEKALRDIEKVLNEKATAAVKTLVSETKSSVRWKMKQVEPTEKEIGDGIAGVFEFQPECLIPPTGVVSVLRTKLRSSEVQLPLSLRKFKVHLDHDTYYRPKAKLDEEAITAKFAFVPLDFLKTTDVSVRIVQPKEPPDPTEPKAETLLGKYMIPICKP